MTDSVALKASKLSETLARDNRLVNQSHSYSKAARKKMNSRKQSRRHENMCFLFSLMRDGEGSDQEDDEFNLVTEKETPFSRVLLMSINLEAWTSFISQSGENQDKYIEKLSKSKEAATTSLIRNQADQHSSQFNKIDRNIKTVLKSREASLDYVEKYECELIAKLIAEYEDENEEKRSSYLIEDVTCSFERMILHGVCQFYSLESKSVKSWGKVGVVVACPAKPEKAEPKLLSAYLRNNFYNVNQRAVSCC